MKGMFGLIGLLLALALVGVLVKKQMASTGLGTPALQAPAVDGASSAASAPGGTVREQSQHIQQQYKQAVEEAMQKPRDVPDDK